MTRVQDFITDHIRARKSFTEIKKKQWKLPTGTGAWVLCKDTELLSRQGARHLNLKKTVRKANIIASVAAAVADDQQIDTRSLHAAYGIQNLQLKRPEMMSQQWFFHWDNAPLLIAAMVSSWCNAHGIQWLEHPSYSPNLASADFFLFKKAKMGAGRPEPGPGRHKKRLGGGHEITDHRHLCRCLQKLAGALQKVRLPWQWVHQKILRNKHPPSSNRCQFIKDLHLFVFTPRTIDIQWESLIDGSTVDKQE